MATKETLSTSKAGVSPDVVNWGQHQILESCEQASRTWIDRMQSEISLWSDLASKLSSTKSVPEAFETYTKCMSQRMQDGR
jgi:hypothetical protein